MKTHNAASERERASRQVGIWLRVSTEDQVGALRTPREAGLGSAADEKLVRGYTVKTKHMTVEPEEKAQHKKAVEIVILDTVRWLRE